MSGVQQRLPGLLNLTVLTAPSLSGEKDEVERALVDVDVSIECGLPLLRGLDGRVHDSLDVIMLADLLDDGLPVLSQECHEVRVIIVFGQEFLDGVQRESEGLERAIRLSPLEVVVAVDPVSSDLINTRRHEKTTPVVVKKVKLP